jgi:DNA repair protein RecO (recombination protein O)
MLLDIFTAEYGRVGVVARGTRRPSRKGSSAALLQPFIPLLLSFTGRSELKTLTSVEAAPGSFTLQGQRLFSGMYMNELLVRLLHRNDAHPALFAAYDKTLKQLADLAVIDSALRYFEFTMLDEMGYGFDLTVDGISGERVQAGRRYRYDPDHGLVGLAAVNDITDAAFSGADLLVMAAGEFGGAVRLAAKHLLREALAVHLGSAPLRSRELFRAARPATSSYAAPVKASGEDGAGH